MQEDSINRLEAIRATKPGMLKAASKAVAEGRVDPQRFGLSKQQLADAITAPPNKLESMAVNSMALEAIVKLTGRPPLLVENNAVVLEPLEDFPVGTDVMIKAVEPFVPSIGRVEFINYNMPWGGTAWVVDKKADGHIVLTNRHVAKLVAKRSADGKAVYMRSPVTGVKYGAQVDFNEEVGAKPTDARVAQAFEIVYLADDVGADMSLLKIKKVADGVWSMPDPVPLAVKEAVDQELVALVGYPAYDSRNDANVMDRYFRDLYDVKRFAPGRVMKTTVDSVLSHDCTSLGGNSGSSLISLEQKAAVGLHFAGSYGISNSAVGVTTIKQLLKGSLVPVGGMESPAATEAAADGLHNPGDFADRQGFDPDFLGPDLAAPWPTLPASIEADLAKPSDATAARPNELRYTHFGVKFSNTFKLPVLTAVNIDGEKSVRIKRVGDKWFFDGRIDKTFQHGQKAYKNESIDRGHMVRREDPNWGDEAAQADSDTFHYTNAAPQHSLLNQGKQLWQGLENYILDSARTHGFKACVFTAPVYTDDDPVLEEENVRVPLEFWKVVVMEDSDRNKLHATAYLLSQGQLIRKLLEDRNRSEAVEGFVLGPYRTFQIAIADLEAATGYGFGGLKDADPLKKTEAGREAINAGIPVVVPIEESADLVL
ncbi:DNA/RNA non-specific endonuclease [uncultured Bradyrhizobium sp.]|uniref:DNA/RNA non-specific endonuclease n=1 Tax=uncultured Bradyrhizobium sp. TaxID=199684 RepID=UPI0035C955A1